MTLGQNKKTRFQEIIFLLTLMSSLSVLTSGYLFLNLKKASLIPLLGQPGFTLINSLFLTMGLGYFLLATFVLILGYQIITYSPTIRDLRKAIPSTGKALLIFAVITILACAFITNWEVFVKATPWPNHTFGRGGWLGLYLGMLLNNSVGFFGATVILLATGATLATAAGIVLPSEFIMAIAKKSKNIIKRIISWTHDFLFTTSEIKPLKWQTEIGNTCFFNPNQKDTIAKNQTKNKISRDPVVPRKWDDYGRLRTEHFHIYPHSQIPKKKDPVEGPKATNPEDIASPGQDKVK